MAKYTEILDHFRTLARQEAWRELERVALEVNKTRDQAILAGSFGGSRMFVSIAQNYGNGLSRFREFLIAKYTEHLKSVVVSAVPADQVEIQEGILEAFDQATEKLLGSLDEVTARHRDGHAARPSFTATAQRERASLAAELGAGLSPKEQVARPSAPSRHRLAAILATDVAGYTRLMANDEAATLTALAASMDAISEIVARNGGRIVKTIGDGTLSEFPSCVDAVRAAVEAQSAMEDQNRTKPTERQLVLRMGLAVGDVAANGDDILGDVVNLAARLESVAIPGTIYITSFMRADLANKLAYSYEDLGRKEIKGIADPVHVFRVKPV